jgi:hypothetical protein
MTLSEWRTHTVVVHGGSTGGKATPHLPEDYVRIR